MRYSTSQKGSIYVDRQLRQRFEEQPYPKPLPTHSTYHFLISMVNFRDPTVVAQDYRVYTFSTQEIP